MHLQPLKHVSHCLTCGPSPSFSGTLAPGPWCSFHFLFSCHVLSLSLLRVIHRLPCHCSVTSLMLQLSFLPPTLATYFHGHTLRPVIPQCPCLLQNVPARLLPLTASSCLPGVLAFPLQCFPTILILSSYSSPLPISPHHLYLPSHPAKILYFLFSYTLSF